MFKRYTAEAAAGSGGGPWVELEESADGDLIKVSEVVESIAAISKEIAATIMDEWSVGVASTFCDESDWDAASMDEVAEKVAKCIMTKFSST